MRKPGGYAYVFDGDGTVKETDSCTCAHCNKIFHVGVRQRPEDIGGMCGGCKKIICSVCVNEGGCDPIEEKLLRWEASYHARRSYGF